MSDAPIVVTKMDAAKRQLRTAITLWFADGDPVSIHALAYAAHEVIHELFRRRGLRGLMFDSPFIREEYRTDFSKGLKAAAAFFKHAQKDPDAVTAFNPALNVSLMLFAIHGLGSMREPFDLPELALISWFQIKEPRLFVENIFAQSFPIEMLNGLRRMEKKDFFEGCQIAFAHARDNRLLPQGPSSN